MNKHDVASNTVVAKQGPTLAHWSLLIAAAGLLFAMGSAVGALTYKSGQTDTLTVKVNQLQSQLDASTVQLAAAKATIQGRAAFVEEMDRLQKKADALDKQITPEGMREAYDTSGHDTTTTAAMHAQFLGQQRTEVGQLMQALMAHCPN